MGLSGVHHEYLPKLLQAGSPSVHAEKLTLRDDEGPTPMASTAFSGCSCFVARGLKTLG